jgi:hypothetical protein
MNQAEALIKCMIKTGSTAKAIAGELYGRGLKNGLGRTYTTAMIEGFLRYTGLDEQQLEASALNRPAPPAPTPAPIVVTPSPAKVSPYSKDAEPVSEAPRRLRMLRPWPLHTDYRPDNLKVRD